MKKTLILVTAILIAFGMFAWAKGKPELKAPKAPKAPKLSAEALKLPEGLPGEAGAIVVAMIPFGYTAGVGSEKAIQAAKTVTMALQSSGQFRPTSLKDWMMANFKSERAANVQAMLDRAAEVKLPIHYVCTGNLFRGGGTDGLAISLYPLDRTLPASHYFRCTALFSDLDVLARDIVREMSLRTLRPAAPLVQGTIFVGDIGLSLRLVDKASKKETELEFGTCEGVQYYREDQFLADLLQYTLHASGVAATAVGGQKDYFEGKPTSESAYVVSGQLKITKKDLKDRRNAEKLLTITVARASDPSTVVFSNQYVLNSMGLESLYESSRIWAKDILLSILGPEQRGQVGEVDVPSFCGNEGIYLNDYYLGRGNQANLLVPAGRSTVKTYYAKKWKEERVIGVSPYAANEISSDHLLAGAFYQQGFLPGLPQLLFGGGFSLTLNRGDWELNTTVSETYGKFDDGQFSLATRIGVAPGLLFLPDDSALRLYADLGLFASFWTDTVGSSRASFFSLGLFPEGGLTFTIAPFQIRFGVGYDFDLVRYVTSTQPAASVAALDLSGLAGRLGFSYFLK